VPNKLSDIFALGLAPGLSAKSTGVLQSDIKLTDGGFWSRWFGVSNWSGKLVNVNTALQLATVMACVRLISETLATLPVNVYRTGANGTKKLVTDHQLYFLLHTQPNAYMTATVFWQAVIASMLLQGNSYVEKVYTGASRTTIAALNFLMADRVTWKWLPDGSREWYYDDPQLRRVRTIQDADMWHLMAFTLDGVCGISPVRYGANVLGGAMAADQASAETFRHALKSPGIVTMDAVMKKEQREDVREHVNKVSAEGGVMVLEKGSAFQQISMNPDDAELLTSRQFAIEEMCRWFGVPPSMVGHGEKVSNWGTGVEQQMIGFVTFVLRRWSVRIEQSARKDLMSPADKANLSVEFALEGLMRGDSAARAAFYGIMVDKGIYTRDFCRSLENQPPMGGNAAKLTVQSAMTLLDKVGEQPPAPNPQQGGAEPGKPAPSPAPEPGKP
jgi:HK97 family phage portal protein